MKIVKKKWGEETWMVNDEYCGKLLRVDEYHQSSLHYHKKKDETFYFMDNAIEIEIGDSIIHPSEGDWIRIPPMTPHRFRLASLTMRHYSTIFEISTHHDDEDVVRLEESK